MSVSIGVGDKAIERASDLRISVFASPAECTELWRRMAGECACYVFQSCEWQAAWQETVGAAESVQPCIVHVAGAGGRMLLPLGIYRHFGLRVLRFLGGLVTDYSAPVIDPGLAAHLDPRQVAQLWRDILRLLPNVDLVWLRRMPETVEGVRNPLVSLPGAVHSENASAARLPATMAQFRATHAVDWPDTRRRRRRLAEQGRVAFEIAATPEAARDMLQELAALKSLHWRRTGSRGLFGEPGYLEFYRALTLAGVPAAQTHLSCLRVDDRTVAAHWGIVFRGRFYHLLTAFAAEWRRYAVGRLLIEHLVEWCIAQPDLRLFDFTAGAEPYKREWTDNSLPLYELVAARSLRGAFFVAARAVKERLKRHRGLRNFVRRLKGRRPL